MSDNIIDSTAILPSRLYTFQGIKCYDPRVDKHISTGNPALVMGYLLNKHLILAEDIDASYDNKEFWDRIKVLADYCEEPVTKI